MPAKKKVTTSKSKSKKSKSKVKVSYTVYFIHYAYCLAIIVLLTITGFNIDKAISQNKKVLGASIDVTPLQNEKAYWQDLITKTPTYIDGYLELAKVEVELGNTNEATGYITKALSLDPNSAKIVEVQKQLGL